MAGKSNTRRAGDKISDYRRKRDATRTPEPFEAGTPQDESLLFVVQLHNARRTHYDLRLELNGVLMSFAVPRGIPETAADKHLAVHTEDHPLSYADFEGFIPKGNYGAGEMVIWDRGRFVPWGDPAKGIEKGKLLFELHGEKVHALFTLVRTKGERQWLLMKKPPDWRGASADLVMLIKEEMERAGAKKGKLHIKDTELMLAEPYPRAFSGPEWLFELKYDGYRLLAEKSAGRAHLRYRRGNDVSERFAEITAAVLRLGCREVLIDGELVVLKASGHTDFHALARRAHLTRAHVAASAAIAQKPRRGLAPRKASTEARAIAEGIKRNPSSLIAFDLLALDGYDLRPLPLYLRKRWLEMLLRTQKSVLRYARHIDEAGEALFDKVRAENLEGIVGKRRDSGYTGGRSDDWRKIRVVHNGDFAVIGFGLPERGRAGFSSLHLALKKGRGWQYMGRCGSGFDGATLTRLRKTLDTAVRKTAVCEVPAEERKNSVWVEPALVVQVRYHSITDDGRLRQSVFERLRDDKDAASVCGDAALTAATPTTLTVSNPKKVFFPALKLTKGDLVSYYRAIAPWALPYYKNRPAVLTRYPDGIDGKSFFQKDAPDFAPSWLRTVRMFSDSTHRHIDHFVLESADALAYVANLGTIPIHVWSSCIGRIDNPDYTIIDLDPKSAPFTDVVTLALAVRKLCDDIALPCYVKTTGSSGLHVLIPLHRTCTYAQSKLFAELIARALLRRHPDIATLERDPKKRRAKVYLDCFQNGHGKTIAAAFCVRPVPEAAVSMPLKWSELTNKLTPRQFTMKNALKHVERWTEDPVLPALSQEVDLVAALNRLESLL